MPRAAPAQRSFNAGEWSTLLYGRTDHEKYDAALSLCENFVPTVQGPLTRRPGTVFVSKVKDSSKATRVVPFEFSTTQAYILEFGDQYIRFYKDNGQITLTAQNITGITQANPAVVTYDGSDTYSNGDKIVITGVVGMVEVNNREFTVANVNAGSNTFELSGVDSTNYGAWSSGGSVAEIYEISSPYLEADLFELKFTQSADVLYITHPSYAPRTLTRTAHTSWTLSTITFKDGPYLNENTSATTLTLGATSGSTTVTASTDTFVSTDVGRIIRFKSGGTTWGWLTITAYTSATQVTATVERSPNAATASATWRLGVWSATTGYPSCVTFYEDRLFFAGATSYPQRIDGSNVSDYPNFAPSDSTGTVTDSNAVSFTLNSNDVNVIRWMIDDEKGLLIGTAGGEWILRPSSLSEALSATNVTAKRSTGYGSANIQCIRAGRSAVYVQSRGRKLRELSYIYEIDGFRSPDMTMFAEHITSGGIKEIAFQQEPYSIIWAVRNDGVLLGLTFEKDQAVMGWHKHIIGGSFSSGDSVVESIAVIPAADGARDEAWVVVKRTVNGVTVRYIEYMNKVWETGDTLVGCVYLDSALTYSGAGVTTLSGLYHLEGQTVSVLVNGATHPDKTVSGGAITLDRTATSATVGLPYESDMQTLNLEAGAADGTAQGKTKRINRVTFRFNDTVGVQVGPNSTNLKEIPFRSSANLMDTATNLFTGDKTIEWNGGYELEGRVYLRQDQPLPLTLVSIYPQVVTQDRG